MKTELQAAEGPQRATRPSAGCPRCLTLARCFPDAAEGMGLFGRVERQVRGGGGAPSITKAVPPIVPSLQWGEIAAGGVGGTVSGGPWWGGCSPPWVGEIAFCYLVLLGISAPARH